MRLQHYLLQELLAAFLLILTLVTGVMFVGLILQFMHKFPEVGLVAVLKAAPAIAPIALPITVPLSFLVACLLTYGRFSDDNEFTAFRMGGISPWHAISPALLVGLVLSLATFHVNATVIPLANVAQKTIGRDTFVQLSRALADPARSTVEVGDLQVVWKGREAGWLKDVLITGLSPHESGDGDEEGPPLAVIAERCRITLEPDSDAVVIELRKLRYERVDAAGNVGSLTEDFHWFTYALGGETKAHRHKGTDYLRVNELVYRLQHGSVDERLVRKWSVELWRRIALSLAPLAFGLFGPALGLVAARGSKMVALVTALVVALPVYYPLLQLGRKLGEAGALPAPLALNLGNIVLLTAGGVLTYRVIRR